MAAYRFRISFEDYEDTYREVELRSTHTFKDLFKMIQSSIGFDDIHPATFYMSNDHWLKGQEIVSDKKSAKTPSFVLIKDAKLCDYITDPHQKIYYIYDPEKEWAFHIELVKIIPSGNELYELPRIAKAHGDVPAQYKTNNVPVPDDEMEGIAEPEEEKEEHSMAAEDSEPAGLEDFNEETSDNEEGEEDVSEEETEKDEEY